MLLLFCYCYVLLVPQPSLSSSTHACTRSFVHPSSHGRPCTQFPAPPHTTTMKRFRFQLFTVETLNHCANLKPGYKLVNKPTTGLARLAHSFTHTLASWVLELHSELLKKPGGVAVTEWHPIVHHHQRQHNVTGWHPIQCSLSLATPHKFNLQAWWSWHCRRCWHRLVVPDCSHNLLKWPSFTHCGPIHSPQVVTHFTRSSSVTVLPGPLSSVPLRWPAKQSPSLGTWHFLPAPDWFIHFALWHLGMWADFCRFGLFTLSL